MIRFFNSISNGNLKEAYTDVQLLNLIRFSGLYTSPTYDMEFIVCVLVAYVPFIKLKRILLYLLLMLSSTTEMFLFILSK